jgi:hypothetical protein
MSDNALNFERSLEAALRARAERAVTTIDADAVATFAIQVARRRRFWRPRWVDNRLRASWFAEGPPHVSDRAFGQALERLGRQRQRPAWHLWPWRFPTLSRPLRLSILIGTLLVALAALAAIGGSSRQRPSPTVTSTAEPSVAVSLPELRTQTFGIPLSYTLPAGWEVRGESPSLLQFVSWGAVSPSVVTLTPIGTLVASPDCASGHSTTTKLDQIVARLRANPAFDIRSVTQTTVDGRRAVAMTVTLSPDWRRTCLNSRGKPAAAFLADPIGLFHELDAGQAVRLVLVDIAGAGGSASPPASSRTLLIAASGTPETLDAAVAQARPIIESIRFRTAGR